MNWWILRRRVHISWLIASLCFGIALGVVFSKESAVLFFGSWIWLCVALSLIALSLWRSKLYVIPIIIIAGGVVGLWRGAIVQVALQPYANCIGKQVILRGVVDEDPEVDAKQAMTLHVAVTTINGHSLPGKIWITLPESREIKRGDVPTLKGILQPGFGAFVGSMYRADVQSVMRSHPPDFAMTIRQWFGEQIHKVLPSDQAALGIGFLTGQKQAIPPELDEAMRTVGLTHIVVASGYNLTILVRLARRVFSRISKYLAGLFGAGMIAGFMAITGLSPSMSRAGLVSGLSLAAWYYGRKFHPLVLLPLTAAVTLLINPAYGWGDLGWQLSFAAFAGVMIVAPLLQAYFFGKKKPGVLRQVVGETIAAEMVTLPILIAAFGQFSNVALLANVLVVPLVPVAMALTFLAGITVPIFGWLAAVVGWTAHAVLTYMIAVVDFLAVLPFATTELTLPWWSVALAYGALILGCFWMWRVTRYDLRTANLVE
ncbi:MAG TPA: ComEC/Rec2 family competence protein [Candidatus Saccharimonadales bacterium]|nr:ComEC/Rec2 family competence protein [Candidatus Saccharimonadales bacterium]